MKHMGVININNGDKPFSIFYNNVGILYYWSGYTETMITHTKEIVEVIKHYPGYMYIDPSFNDGNQLILNIIRWLELNGGGIDSCEKSAFRTIFPTELFNDGSIVERGIFYITAPNIERVNKTSDRSIVININTNMIDFDGIDKIDLSEYLEERHEDKDSINITDLVECPFDPLHFEMNKIDELEKFVKTLTNSHKTVFRYKEECYQIII